MMSIHIFFFIILTLGQKQSSVEKQQITIESGDLFYVRQPNSIARVFRSIVSSNSLTLNCNQIKNQAYISTEFKYLLQGYHSFEEDMQQWQTQIVSATYDKITGTVWALLSQGDLLKLETSFERNKMLEEVNRYKITQAKGWIDGKLTSIKNQLYLKEENIAWKIIINQKEWSRQQIEVNDSVVQLLADEDRLYILTKNHLYILKENQPIIAFRSTTQTVFKDVSIKNNFIFLLKGNGLQIIHKSTLQSKKNISIEQIQWAKSIKAGLDYFIIHFQKHGGSIIRQYSYAEDGSVNAQTIHREFSRIRNIAMLGNYGLVQSSFELSLFHRSINKEEIAGLYNRPLEFKYQNLVTVEYTELSPSSLLLAGPNFVQLSQIKNKIDFLQIFKEIIVCSQKQVGKYKLEVAFEGVCAHDLSQSCKENKQIQLFVEPNSAENLAQPIQIALMIGLTAVLVITVSLFLFFRKNFSHQIEQQRLVLEKKKLDHSLVELQIGNKVSPDKRSALNLIE